jgi:uncharacterized protein YbbC (DUF1343 family)
LGQAGAVSGQRPARTAEAPARAAVRPGIDVLLSDSLHLVRGRRVGLLTNQAGVDASGMRDVDRLRAAGVELVALFSAEHGFRGTAGPGAEVGSATDSATGLPIYSLYGSTSPPLEQILPSLDAVLVDLPDVGARYFTYAATTLDLMRVAARYGRAVIVLDRPNPVGGTVQGNVLDPRYRSNVGVTAVPMRYGLSAGELARLARSDLGLTTELIVVPVQHWHRRDALDRTGLPFLAPSPNLRSLESLFHYPGLCLFEGTALSVGRGSEAPFEQVGAPWLDSSQVLRRLRSAQLPGVRFRATTFTPVAPGDGKFSDTLVVGIRLRVTDRATYDPTLTAVTLLGVVQAVHPDRIGWSPERFDRLAGGPQLREAIQAGRSARSIVQQWRPALRAFLARRKAFLLYPE